MILTEIFKALQAWRAQRVVAKTTLANIISNYPASSQVVGAIALATDVGPLPGTWFHVTSEGLWRVINNGVAMYSSVQQYVNIGGSGATYSQSGTTVTVTWTAHTMTAEQNGARVYLTQSTGTFVTEWCSNFTYVDANTFTCTSATSRTTSGNLGTNTAETFIPWTFTMPAGLIKSLDLLGISWFNRAKVSANNKTVKPYYSGNQITAAAGISITNSGLWTGGNSTTMSFISDSTYILSLISSTAATDSTRSFTLSSTLANAGDWHSVMVYGIPYQPRYGSMP